MIPGEAAEAAAKWLHDNNCRSALHSGFPADFECYDWLDEAKELLEAAAPHMVAGAWDAGFDKGFYDPLAGGGRDASESATPNPYRPNE